MRSAGEHEEPEPEGGTRSHLSGSASDVVQARDVHGGVHFHGPEHSATPVPRQLPALVRAFVNRAAELDRLDQVLAGDPEEPLTVGMSLVTGTAGVGKTSLALHWAHRIRGHFPDGQLYLNLRGYDPGTPVGPAQALDYFLRALGVAPGAIPADLDARAALYRSLLAERRVLVLLDNAATAGQVRPLLPGTAGCLVLVTSRSRLAGLVFRDGAHRLSLDVLTESEAVGLLRAVTLGYRSGGDADQLLALARLCARLPLALRIAAERAARRPEMPLSELIDDLRDESGLWDALSADDDEEADAVRTVFAWSYRALSVESARMFRLLGLHPGAEFGAPAAAALAGTSAGQVRRLLDTLVGAHLLEHTAPDRYQFHDLLRVYATEQANREEAEPGRRQALRRLLTWYLHTVSAAQALISPLERAISLEPTEPEVTPLDFAGVDEATGWYEAERANLVAATRAAADAGLDRIAWQLPVLLRGIFMRHNPFDDWLDTARVGLAAARGLHDQAAEAELLESLAMACSQSQRLEQGLEYYRSALTARRALDDRFGEAMALNGIGLLHLRRRALAEAVTNFERSRGILTGLDLPYWDAVVLGNLAQADLELENLAEAAACLDRALPVLSDQDDRGIEGNALHLLSMVQRGLGKPESALQHIQRALGIAREHNNRLWEGYWLLELGRVQRELGQPAEALVSYQRAAMLQRRLGDRGREAQALDGTGETYQELGRPDEAMGFHRLARTTHGELGDRWQLVISLGNLANAARRAGEGETESTRLWREAVENLAGFDDPKATRLRRHLRERLEAR
ncbi:ATP-binding protein [Amycolatopsis cihanbeyliensis]|uniref:Tetratricopeptide repeat protein n=1 Tax=Amycolatopsis cihanbeyliensis TaxID=1128664 RepID=A0A542DRW4_AMYCI|nr:tetratricopeptide repeat protein [Amycolatopsis cihanbeyliensis]TQJ05863.1 tetratricopeptide repeat protein [Amycolatopsis cihanbeyliensis]